MNDTCALAPRQREIVTLVVAGASNKEIARELGVSIKTVKNTLTRVFIKTGTHPSQHKDSVKFALIGKTQPVVSCGHEPDNQTPQPRSCATHQPTQSR